MPESIHAQKRRRAREARDARLEAHFELVRNHNAEQMLYPPSPYKRRRYDKEYDVFIVQAHKPITNP